MLYDTYGFPLDLTELMARDDNLLIDIKEFNKCMEQQKIRAKKTNNFSIKSQNIKWNILGDDLETEFLGYENNQASAKVIKYYKNNNKIGLVLDQTPFYAESGGQIADSGNLLPLDVALPRNFEGWHEIINNDFLEITFVILQAFSV